MYIKKNYKNIPLKNRTYFYKNEELLFGEDLFTEFKNYQLPFSNQNIKEIKKQICAFLNSKGGRIYIGIDDNKIVKGVELTYKKLDEIRNSLINYTNEFFPKCRTNKINIMFIPIKNVNNQYIKNLYIIKIIIHQGDTDQLYSTIERGGYISFIRLSGQCINLSAQEIRDEIINRNKNPEKSLSKSEFLDPQPENPNLFQITNSINELNFKINNLNLSNYNNNYYSLDKKELRRNYTNYKSFHDEEKGHYENIFNEDENEEEEEEEEEHEEYEDDENNQGEYEEEEDSNENENEEESDEIENQEIIPKNRIISCRNLGKNNVDENYVIKISTFGEIASIKTLKSLFNNIPNCRKKFLKRNGKVHGFLNFSNYLDAVRLINKYNSNLNNYSKFGVRLSFK